MVRRALVSLLACLLAGFLCVPSWAETVVLPEPYETNIVSVISLDTWVSLEDTPVIVLTESERDNFVDVCKYYIETIDWYAAGVSSTLDNDLNIVRSALRRSDDTTGEVASALAFLDTVQDDADYTLNLLYDQLMNVDYNIDYLADMDLTNVISSVSVRQAYGSSNGDGSCSCPDYTVYLTNLLSRVESVDQFCNNTLLACIQGIIQGSGNSLTWSGRYNFGYSLGDLLAFLLDCRSGWDAIISTGYTSGSVAAETLLKYWEWSGGVSVTNSVFVTNTPSSPLWCSITNTFPISVSLSSSGPLSVTFDGASISNFNVSVTNFSDLVCMLTNSYVSEERFTAELDFADQALSGVDSFTEEDDEGLSIVDTSTFNTVGRQLVTIVRSYKGLFDENICPSSLPYYISLSDGFTIGTYEVGPMHWVIDGSTERLLNGIRGIFRAFWYVGFLLVIYYTVAVHFLVSGSLMYSVYGVLLGKPEKIVEGLHKVWLVFCSLLGMSHQK